VIGRLQEKLIADAVTRAESQFKVQKPVKLEKESLPEIVARHNAEMKILRLKSEFETLATLRAHSASSLVNLRTALFSAENSMRLIELNLELTRATIDSEFEKLGQETPVQYHERSCGCDSCDQLGSHE
jgi:hypothetical protein